MNPASHWLDWGRTQSTWHKGHLIQRTPKQMPTLCFPAFEMDAMTEQSIRPKQRPIHNVGKQSSSLGHGEKLLPDFLPLHPVPSWLSDDTCPASLTVDVEVEPSKWSLKDPQPLPSPWSIPQLPRWALSLRPPHSWLSCSFNLHCLFLALQSLSNSSKSRLNIVPLQRVSYDFLPCSPIRIGFVNSATLLWNTMWETRREHPH